MSITNQNVRTLPRKSEDDFADVVIRVPNKTMTDAWADLEDPMKRSPDFEIMMTEPDFDPQFIFDDEQLKLLVGAFGAAVDYLPMGPFEYLRWVGRWDTKLSSGQYVREFVQHQRHKTA